MSVYSKFEKRALVKIFSERVLENVKGVIILTSSVPGTLHLLCAVFRYPRSL